MTTLPKKITNMKKFYLVLICIATITLISSCSKSKSDMVIDGFEELVEEVEKKKGDMTAEEWIKIQDDFNKRFEELGIENIDEKEFSAMLKLKLAGLTVRWGTAMAESSPRLIESALEQAEKDSENKE